MKADQQLNICEEVIPVSLALCKSALAQLADGAVLEIHLRDRGTLEDLQMIVERCGDQILAWENREEYYSLWVRKSPRQ
jgi:TusA-related sulfurtransferase